MRHKSTASPGPKFGSSSAPSFNGWGGRFAHPDSYHGGGGPGRFTQPKPMGVNYKTSAGSPPPQAPNKKRREPESPPTPFKPLEKFSGGVGVYSVEEMNAALLAMFNEIGDENGDFYPGAKAVAATIFNRATLLQRLRVNVVRIYNQKKALEEKNETIPLNQTNPSKMPTEEVERQKQIKREIFERKVKIQALFKELTTANNRRVSIETYIYKDPALKLQDLVKNPSPYLNRISLVDVVGIRNGQYVAYMEGHSKNRIARYNKNPKSNKSDYERWETIKNVLKLFAATPAQRLKFVEFHRADGTFQETKTDPFKKLINGARIAGNDFWEIDWANEFLP